MNSKFGTRQLLYDNHLFNRHVHRNGITYWRCTQFCVFRCRARVKSKADTLTILNGLHNHEVVTETRKYGSLKYIKESIKQQQLQIPGTNEANYILN